MNNQNSNTPLILKEYINRILEQLLKADFTPEQAKNLLQDLEEEIYDSISDNLVNKLSEEELTKLDQTDTTALDNTTEIAKLAGTSEKEITTQVLRKLEDYLAALPQNLPALKQKYQNNPNTPNPSN